MCTSVLFERDRYVLLPSLLKDPELRHFYRYACQAARGTGCKPGDPQVPGTPCAYGDFMMDDLLAGLLPQIEIASGLALFPTYSYFRAYKEGDVLKRHTDRPSCEVSVTLCLGFEGGESWPLWVEGPGGVSRVSLGAGDALLYRGIECPHWRETYKGQLQIQVFLHYVNQKGPHAEWKFDKRETISPLVPRGIR